MEKTTIFAATDDPKAVIEIHPCLPLPPILISFILLQHDCLSRLLPWSSFLKCQNSWLSFCLSIMWHSYNHPFKVITGQESCPVLNDNKGQLLPNLEGQFSLSQAFQNEEYKITRQPSDFKIRERSYFSVEAHLPQSNTKSSKLTLMLQGWEISMRWKIQRDGSLT